MNNKSQAPQQHFQSNLSPTSISVLQNNPKSDPNKLIYKHEPSPHKFHLLWPFPTSQTHLLQCCGGQTCSSQSNSVRQQFNIQHTSNTLHLLGRAGLNPQLWMCEQRGILTIHISIWELWAPLSTQLQLLHSWIKRKIVKEEVLFQASVL